MAFSYSMDSNSIGKQLYKAGLIPKDAQSVTIHLEVNKVVTITSKVIAPTEQVEGIITALAEANSSGSKIAHTMFVSDEDKSTQVRINLDR
jgi:hypothetical protein